MLKRMHESGDGRRQNLFVCCIVLAATWLGTGLFIPHHLIRAAASLIGAFFLMKEIRRWLHSRRLLYCREQYKWLLEHLLSRLSAGATLERSFIDAPGSLSGFLGKKAGLSGALDRIAAQLEARHPLDTLLPDLGDYLPLPETRSFFHALPSLRQSGGDICLFVRRNLNLAAGQLILQKDLEAESAQRRTEAIILSIMPFAMAGFLIQSDHFFNHHQDSSLMITAGSAAVWFLSMLAAILVIRALAPEVKQPNRKPGLKQLRWSDRFLFLGKHLRRLYRISAPAVYGSRLLRVIQDEARVSGQNPEYATTCFFNTKAVCISVGILPALLIIVNRPGLFILACILPVAFGFIQDREILARANRQKLEDQLVYPIFLNLAAALLQSGLSLHKAMATTIANLSDQLQSVALQFHLEEYKRKTQVGVTAGQALDELASGCSIPQVQSALMMMARYGKDGGPENLQILQMQIDSCWALHRQSARKKIDQATLRLLLPMALDLAAVMLTALLPAIQTLQSIQGG